MMEKPDLTQASDADLIAEVKKRRLMFHDIVINYPEGEFEKMVQECLTNLFKM